MINKFKYLTGAGNKQVAVIFTLLLSVTTIITLEGDACAANNSLPQSAYVASKQLLEALPLPEKFPKELSPLEKEFKNAMSSKDETLANAKFHKVIDNADLLLQKLPRGLHDELIFIKALSFEQLKQPQEAKDLYKKALSLRADNHIALFRYAHLLLQDGNCQEALPLLYESAWRNKTNTHQIEYVIGECLLLLSRNDEALSFFEMSATSSKHFLPTHRRLLEIYNGKIKQTNLPEERQIIESKIVASLNVITTQDPSDIESAVRYSRYLLENSDPLVNAGNLEHAKHIAKSAVDNSKYKEETAVRVYADILMREKNFTKADSVIAKGLEQNNTSQILKDVKKQLDIEKALLEQDTGDI